MIRSMILWLYFYMSKFIRRVSYGSDRSCKLFLLCIKKLSLLNYTSFYLASLNPLLKFSPIDTFVLVVLARAVLRYCATG